jgi:hypothetical protein
VGQDSQRQIAQLTNYQPTVHHPLEAYYHSVVDESQLVDVGISPW